MLIVWALQLAAPCASDVEHDKASVHAAAHKVPKMLASRGPWARALRR
jgi:hypothetical protein